jgi:hypothetical protein
MIVDAVMIVLLPLVTFVAGARLMAAWTRRERVTRRLQQHAAPRDRKPLNQRLHYDLGAVQRHWGALDREALAAEKQFLQLDLVFPLLYGAAFIISLLLGARMAGPAIDRAWLLGLVTVIILSDWTENLLQLAQLRRYRMGGAAGLESRWIAVASVATAIKLVSFATATLTVIVLAVATATRGTP